MNREEMISRTLDRTEPWDMLSFPQCTCCDAGGSQGSIADGQGTWEEQEMGKRTGGSVSADGREVSSRHLTLQQYFYFNSLVQPLWEWLPQSKSSIIINCGCKTKRRELLKRVVSY